MQIALPAAVFLWLGTYSQHLSDPLGIALIDLILLAFFFLFRVGEYTRSPPATQAQRRTVPLRKQDVQLTRAGLNIPNDASDALLDTADAVTISLANQKNGSRGDKIRHGRSNIPFFCPVDSTIRRLKHLRGLPPATALCTVIHQGTQREIRPSAILPLIRFSTVAAGFTPEQGYPPQTIGSHSIRASGAMALKLNGIDDTMIQKLGRWRSETFRRYISPQLANLTVGLASVMTNILTIFNTASTTLVPDSN
jgi:hypothetical protein